MFMRFGSKKPPAVFSPAELARERAKIVERKLGLLPDMVLEDGYYYDGPSVLNAIKKNAKKKLKGKPARA
jgi:hypothetical protein